MNRTDSLKFSITGGFKIFMAVKSENVKHNLYPLRLRLEYEATEILPFL